MTYLAYDVKLKKVGCVLLQAVMGGDSSIAQRIGNEHWLFAPTPDLRIYRMTDEQAEELVAFHQTQRIISNRGRGKPNDERVSIVPSRKKNLNFG